MQLERSEFLGAEAYERTASRRDLSPTDSKDKRMADSSGRACSLEIPQVRAPEVLSRSRLERGCRSEKALKLAIAEMYVKGSLDEESHRDHGAAVWVGDLGHPGLESGRDAGRRAGSSFGKPGAGRVSGSCIWMPTTRRCGSMAAVQDLAILKAIGVNLLGETRSPGGLGGA